MANVLSSPIYGGIAPVTPIFGSVYAGHYGGVSVLPQNDTPAWTRLAVGSPTEAVAYGRLSIATSAASALRYWIEDTDLSNDGGSVVELRAKVTAGSSAANTGLLLEIKNGSVQYVAWIRPGGYNIHDQPAVAKDLTGWHVYRLAGSGVDCLLTIDDAVVQYGHANSLTSETRVGFGTAAGYGYATAEIDWCKARPFYPWGNARDGGWIMTIGPHAGSANIPAVLDGSSFVIVEVDHSAEAVFSLAEPPIFTDANGDSLEDIGIHVEFLCDTNGSGFKVKMTNYSWTGYGYPLVSFLWTRRGFIEV